MIPLFIPLFCQNLTLKKDSINNNILYLREDIQWVYELVKVVCLQNKLIRSIKIKIIEKQDMGKTRKEFSIKLSDIFIINI